MSATANGQLDLETLARRVGEGEIHTGLSVFPDRPGGLMRKQIQRLAALGYTAKVASELEFYLFKETYESAREKHYHDLKPYGSYIQDYHILATTKEEGIVRQIRNHMNAAGIPVEGSKGE